MAYLKFWPDENKGFAFISDRNDFIHSTSIWNWDSDLTLKRKFEYRNRYFQWAYLKCWHDENEGFAFISVRFTIKFTEPVYDTDIETELLNVSLYKLSVISIRNIRNDVNMKMKVLPLFQIAKWLNSLNQYMKLIFRLNSET